jgi:hypothetical protein
LQADFGKVRRIFDTMGICPSLQTAWAGRFNALN